MIPRHHSYFRYRFTIFCANVSDFGKKTKIREKIIADKIIKNLFMNL